MCTDKKKITFQDYGKTVKENREQRDLRRKAFHKDTAATQFILDKFNGKKETSIFFREMDEFFLLDQTVQVNDKITVKKIFRSNTEMHFITTIKAGGSFSWHYHEDCSEVIDVVQGTYYDAYKDECHSAGEQIIYLSGVRHTPSAVEDTILHVKILKDE